MQSNFYSFLYLIKWTILYFYFLESKVSSKLCVVLVRPSESKLAEQKYTYVFYCVWYNCQTSGQ